MRLDRRSSLALSLGTHCQFRAASKFAGDVEWPTRIGLISVSDSQLSLRNLRFDNDMQIVRVFEHRVGWHGHLQVHPLEGAQVDHKGVHPG